MTLRVVFLALVCGILQFTLWPYPFMCLLLSDMPFP